MNLQEQNRFRDHMRRFEAVLNGIYARMEELGALVEGLERRLAVLEQPREERRGPGRPRKEQAQV